MKIILYPLVAEFRNISNSKLYTYSREGDRNITNTEGFLTGLMNQFSNGNIPSTNSLTIALQKLAGTEGDEGFKSKILKELEKIQGYRK